MLTRKALVKQIKDHCKNERISRRTFGVESCNRSNIVYDLEKGKDVYYDTAYKMWAYMQRNKDTSPPCKSANSPAGLTAGGTSLEGA